MTEPIIVETQVPVSTDVAWHAFTDPDAITQWNFASSDWCCPSAEVDLRPGGRHKARMEARDGSLGFDFQGTYEAVDRPNALVLKLDDGRVSHTTFEVETGGTRVRTAFDPDNGHPIDMQQEGWQAILDNYAAYVRGTTS